MEYRPAVNADIPFIADVYAQNIAALHGTHRSHTVWERLLADPASAYYIVYDATPAAWFRVDDAADALELGMLQVAPSRQRQGIGRYILTVIETMAAQRQKTRVIIHTTEDNLRAQALYTAAGYVLTEIGPCTTADGRERIGYTYQKTLPTGSDC